MIWIPITLFAAVVQTFRFMLQKQLRMDTLSTGGATYARFAYASPFIVAGTLAYLAARGIEFPNLTRMFWLYGFLGGIAQISATMCLVALFQRRNFTVGITLIKTEVLLTAIIGFIILGDAISSWAFVAILLGIFGVLFLSDLPSASGPLMRRVLNKATALGLGAGLLFGFCSVMYRGATQQILSDDVLTRSSVTLMCVILMQFALMSLYLRLREAGQITQVIQAWRVAMWVGILSVAGSIGWFTAFALQNAAYVKAVGQIEVAISLGISVFVFGEKMTRKEGVGVVLLVASILLLILAV